MNFRLDRIVLRRNQNPSLIGSGPGPRRNVQSQLGHSIKRFVAEQRICATKRGDGEYNLPMGLKGPNNLAQGNALGKRATQQPKPCRGATSESRPMSMSPFQGLNTWGVPDPGRCPGLYYRALSGQKCPISTYQVILGAACLCSFLLTFARCGSSAVRALQLKDAE